ncbi:MAG: transglutaminase family protein [Archangium sp.]|nr:transglutaminase family protein [Archangium sp.]MDP3572596.1 transglutaminase family protein [Archangium sp.]
MDADADPAEGRARVDGLAKRVAVLVGGRTDPDFRIRAINTVLFREGEYGYDKSDMMGVKPENTTLWGLLSRRKGNCASLPLLWFAVAERLNYPVFAVSAPEHFFLRYDDGKFRQNIEATSGGGSPSDERIIHELEVPEAAIKSGSMMRSLSKRQFLLELISNAAAMEQRARNLGTAEALLTAVVEEDSRNLGAHYNLALLFSARAALATSFKANSPTLEKALLARQEALAAAAMSHAKIATSLGATAPMTEAYWLKVSRVAGTEAGGVKNPPKPFDLATLLQPGGKPIMVNMTAQFSAPPLDDQKLASKVFTGMRSSSRESVLRAAIPRRT